MPVSSRVSRSESLRSEFSDQSKRVSFHRSVDVKRIPKISEQSANRHLNSSSPLLPVNDKELLLREARNVVKSIDRVQCSVGGEIPGGKQRQVNSAPVNTNRRENSFQRSTGGGSRGASVDRILNSRNSKSYSPAPSSTTTITNGYHNNYHHSAPPPTKIKAGGTTERKLREGSASREIKSQPPSGSTSSNLNSINKTTNNNKSQSSKADKEENGSSSKTVINRVSGTLKRVKSAVNKKKVPPPPKETLKQTAAIRNPNPPPQPKLVITKEKLQTRESSSTSPSPVIIKTTREKLPSRVVRETNPPPEKVVEMTKNPRVSSIVDKLSNMKTSPPPFHYDSQPFSYISGRPKLSSPKEVIYAQVVVGDKDKRTIHRSVKGGGYNNNNNTRGSYDAVDGGYEHSANKMNGSFHHEYGGGVKNGGYTSGDVISSSNDGDYYLDEYLKNAKPRANVTTVLLNNVDDEDFTVEKPHFRFRSVSPKNYSEDFTFNNNTATTTNYNNNSNGFSYGSLGRYNNNSTTSSTRYQQQQQLQQHNYRHRNNENEENTDTEFISRTMHFGDDDFGYHDTSNNKKVDEISNTGYYPHETKETYFGDFYNYKHQQENEKDVLFGNRREEDEDFKLDAQIDKWRGRSRKETTYEEKYDKYDDYYHNARENDDDDDEQDNKFLKKYSTHQFPPQQHGKYESSSYETMDNKSKTEKYDRSSYDASQQSAVTTTENGKKSGSKSEKEITSTKLVKEIEKTRENSLPSAKMVNNVKKSNKGLFSTLTRKEKFPFFTLKKKKTVVDKDVEDVEPTRDGEYHNWSSADDLYRDETSKGSGDYRRNLAMRSSTMVRPVKSKEEELRSKSLDRRFKATPTIVITPNTPAVDESNKPPVFRSRENNLRYFGDTDCEDTKISVPPTWPGVNNSSESENGSRMSGSQRSVYLHAAAVADIPPSGLQRRTLSRDELSNHSGHQKQTRHLARSMSVLAPWRPRHYREKYEMHYSNGGPGGRLPPKPPRSPTRKSPHRATSSDSLLKIDEEREIISSSSNSKSKKSAAAVSRSKSMPKDSRLASWLRRKYKR